MTGAGHPIEPVQRAIPAALGIASSSCGVPPQRPGIVDRGRLAKRFLDEDARMVCVSAPAGYGKTTAAQLWSEADRRPFAWAQINHLDDDPVHLLRHIAAALHLVAPLTGDLVRVLTGPGRPVEIELVPAVGHACAARGPIVLVLDDVHLLTSDPSLAAVSGLVDYLPEGSQLVMVGRVMPDLRRARDRLSGDCADYGAVDLAMDEAEASRLFTHAGLDLDEADLHAIVGRTEGWPAGLGLLLLALSQQGSADAMAFSGRDRLLADYLVEEVLAGVDAPTTEFLLRSSVLERMSPSLLDAVLESEGSAKILDEIERSGNLFLVPLDQEREWYRYHHLFGSMLRARLEVTLPGEAKRLDARASAVLEERGDVGGAVRHAVAAGDTSRAADLVLQHTLAVIDQGTIGILGQWLDLLGETAVARFPAAAISSAWHAIAIADPTRIARAIDAAETSSWEGPLADGSPSVGVAAAAVRAMVAVGGTEGVHRDTEIVRAAGGPRANPWWGFATALQGTSASLTGDHDLARELLVAGLEEVAFSPSFEAGFLGVLALVELYDGDLAEAERRTRRAMHLCEEHNLEGVVLDIPAYAGAALVAAERGRVDEARACALVARRLLARLGDLSPRSAVRGYLALAQAALTLGEHADARGLVADANRARRLDPSCTYFNEQLDGVAAELDRSGVDPSSGVAPITAAELRILEYLPTHLSLQEIAEAVFVSRNTVKSHTLAIYRKLGVSTRSEAVTEARRLGMLADWR